jgi:hypothetical protein
MDRRPAGPKPRSRPGKGPEEPVSVQGLVVDQGTREPLEYAAVSLAPGPAAGAASGTRITDDEGYFVFDSVPPGSYTIVVTLLGYRERRDTLTVEPGDDLDVLVPLSVYPVPWIPSWWRSAVATFRASWRASSSGGGSAAGPSSPGRTSRQRSPMYFSDLLRMVPGARVSPSARYGQVVTLRGGCRPQLWVDGVRTVTSLGDGRHPPTHGRGGRGGLPRRADPRRVRR